MRRADFVGAELVQRTGNRFDRALHVALDDQRELLDAGGLELRSIICSQRSALARLAGSSLVAGQPLTVFGDFAGTGSRSRRRRSWSPACGVP